MSTFDWLHKFTGWYLVPDSFTVVLIFWYGYIYLSMDFSEKCETSKNKNKKTPIFTEKLLPRHFFRQRKFVHFCTRTRKNCKISATNDGWINFMHHRQSTTWPVYFAAWHKRLQPAKGLIYMELKLGECWFHLHWSPSERGFASTSRCLANPPRQAAAMNFQFQSLSEVSRLHLSPSIQETLTLANQQHSLHWEI